MAYAYPCGSSRPAYSIIISMFSWKVRENPAKLTSVTQQIKKIHKRVRKYVLKKLVLQMKILRFCFTETLAEHLIIEWSLVISATLTSSKQKKNKFKTTTYYLNSNCPQQVLI